MRGDGGAKPDIVIRATIQRCDRADARIRLNPLAVSCVGEDVNPIRGHCEIA